MSNNVTACKDYVRKAIRCYCGLEQYSKTSRTSLSNIIAEDLMNGNLVKAFNVSYKEYLNIIVEVLAEEW